jgi:hypothetical protein
MIMRSLGGGSERVQRDQSILSDQSFSLSDTCVGLSDFPHPTPENRGVRIRPKSYSDGD